MKRILFVCTGNICRSPTAEAVARHFVETGGLGAQVLLDSAGRYSRIGDAERIRKWLDQAVPSATATARARY